METVQQSTQQPAEPTATPKEYGYSKRPLWQWIVLYLVIGGIIYAGIYYFFLRNKGYNYPNQGLIPQYQKTTSQSNTNTEIKKDNTPTQDITGTEGSVNDAAYMYEYDCGVSLEDDLSLQMTAAKKWEPDAAIVSFVRRYNNVVTGAHSWYYIYASSHTTNYLVYGFSLGGSGGPCSKSSFIPSIKSSKELDQMHIVSSQLPLNNPLIVDQIINSSVSLTKINDTWETITNSFGKKQQVHLFQYNGQSVYSNWVQEQLNNSKKLGLFFEITYILNSDSLGDDHSNYNPNEKILYNSTATGFATIKPDGTVMSFKKY